MARLKHQHREADGQCDPLQRSECHHTDHGREADEELPLVDPEEAYERRPVEEANRRGDEHGSQAAGRQELQRTREEQQDGRHGCRRNETSHLCLPACRVAHRRPRIRTGHREPL